MMGGKKMVRRYPLAVTAILFLVSFVFAFRVTQGIDEAQRAIVKAYNLGAKEKAPYTYSKAKGYREIASVLASEADDVGAKVFAIRTMNYASKAISSTFTGEEELTPVEEFGEERKRRRRRKEDFKLIDVDEVKNRIEFLRSNRGMLCAPRELGRAEAFYDALVYEMTKEEPNSALMLKFYNEVSSESKIAESKLKVAMENDLECYTGKPVVAKAEEPKEQEGAKEEEPQETQQAKQEENKEEEKPSEEKPKVSEELLKITARIHFDFDKYDIKKEYIPILNEVVKTLKENSFTKVRIEGFTDIVGSKEYNDKLARKRAEAVKRYLVDKGIPEDRIEIVGIGKDRFIAGNEDDVGRLTNRRVEFVLVKVEGKIPVNKANREADTNTEEKNM